MRMRADLQRCQRGVKEVDFSHLRETMGPSFEKRVLQQSMLI